MYENLCWVSPLLDGLRSDVYLSIVFLNNKNIWALFYPWSL